MSFGDQVQGCGAGDGQEQRLQRIAGPLASDVRGRGLIFQVMDSNSVGAYAWPDGRVVVTRGMMNRLSCDAELAAAVAHELGHLLDDGHLTGVVSLRGSDTGLDVEARADAQGVRLMVAKGLPATAMASMLRKVRALEKGSPDNLAALDHRIALLEARNGSASAARRGVVRGGN